MSAVSRSTGVSRSSIVRRRINGLGVIDARAWFRASPFSSDVFLFDKTCAADAFVRRSIARRLVSVGLRVWLGRFHDELRLSAHSEQTPFLLSGRLAVTTYSMRGIKAYPTSTWME